MLWNTSTIPELRNAIKDLGTRLIKAERQYKLSQAELQKAEEYIDGLTKEYNRRLNISQAEVDEYEVHSGRLAAQVKNLGRANDELRDETNLLKAKLESLQTVNPANVDDREPDLESLRYRVHLAESQVETVTRDKRQLETDLARTRDQLQMSQSRLRETLRGAHPPGYGDQAQVPERIPSYRTIDRRRR